MFNNPINLPAFVATLGDPHLGKKFANNVPLHRRGEREAMVNEQFVQSLNLPHESGCKLHICMGDLFDKFRVPEEIILFAANAYREAAKTFPGRQYVVLRGNHDASRDIDLKSSFDVFAALLNNVPNVEVVTDDVFEVELEKECFMFYPWHPFITAKEMVASVKPPISFWAFGHWDILAFDPDSSASDNLLPFELFQEAAGVVTGHYHTPKVFEEDNVSVWVTGSMQPYSHAEDPAGQLYVTHTLSEVESNLAADVDHYAGLNLRVVLEPEQAAPSDINALSLSFKTVGKEDDLVMDVDIDNFNLESIFRTSMASHDVSEPTTESLWQTLLDLNAEAE